MKVVPLQPWHDRAVEADPPAQTVRVVRCVSHGWVEKLVPVKRPDGLTVGKIVRVYRAYSNTPKFKQEVNK
jgi:hypothetical protein